MPCAVCICSFQECKMQDGVQMKELQGPETGTADCISSDIFIV